MLVAGGILIGIKPFKYFIDSIFRAPVTPVPGSVLYCDLKVLVEHSGIHVGDGGISNIVVDSLLTADATVRRSTAESFTSGSWLGRKIYVSCDKHGPVGNARVAEGADTHVGERSFYGLAIKNCHQFSEKCVNYSDSQVDDESFPESLNVSIPDGTWEPTINSLKAAARKQLGATKWRLWDWDNSLKDNPPPEPDWDAINDHYMRQPLDAESVARMREELAETRDYMAEIADEPIPDAMRKKLQGFAQTLESITAKYDEVKDFLAQCPGSGFSYEDLQDLAGEDFTALARALQGNARIKDMVRKMGRAYIAEDRKKKTRIPEASRSEIHGTRRSDDLMRMLPSELLNLEHEELEMLFYARLLERQLLTYELQGTTLVAGEADMPQQRTGPIVACLDTSGSMNGAPLVKAKALLLAVANILRQEQRSLHVILFGSTGQTREFALEDGQGAAGLLRFLRHGFGGGTDFETPLRRAFEIIADQPSYQKADVLMLSDGDCALSDAFVQTVQARKSALDCRVYSVLCGGQRVADSFSDEVMVL